MWKKAEDKLLQAQIALEHCWTDGNYTAFNDAKEDLNHTLLMEETFLLASEIRYSMA
jgi:hypothetical protein